MNSVGQRVGSGENVRDKYGTDTVQSLTHSGLILRIGIDMRRIQVAYPMVTTATAMNFKARFVDHLRGLVDSLGANFVYDVPALQKSKV